MNRNNIIYSLTISLVFFCSLTSCSDDDDKGGLLKNDCIEYTRGRPKVAGTDIEFTYAMAMPYGSGKIKEAWVEATIPGADGTWMEHNSYHTSGGIDVPVKVGNPSETVDNKTTVEFSRDTCAAALRYYYKIPDEARGQKVSFRFFAKSDNGETVSYQMGPYQISKVEMELDMSLTRANCYISIEDMKAYNATEAASIPDKIDLVYNFRNFNSEGIEFGHVFASPVADPVYLYGMTLPEGLNRDVKIHSVFGAMDYHLARIDTEGLKFVDDLDFETKKFENMPDYAVNMKTKSGMWVETQDGKYRAFIYVNSVRVIAGATISMKRYTMK